MITAENHNEFSDPQIATTQARASKLIKTVLNRIETDSNNFRKFVKVLEEKELYYESVLVKLRVDSVVNEQTTEPSSDSEQGVDENSALLRTLHTQINLEVEHDHQDINEAWRLDVPPHVQRELYFLSANQKRCYHVSYTVQKPFMLYSC